MDKDKWTNADYCRDALDHLKKAEQEMHRVAENENSKVAKDAAQLCVDARTKVNEYLDLLEKRDKEWEDRFKETESKYAVDRAVFEQERRLAEVEQYRRQRVEQEQEEIIPALWDMVSGNSPEEIEQSIAYMKQRSEVIAQNFAAAAAASQQQVPFRGAAMPSVPPVGPLEQLPVNQQVTDQMVKDMPMDEYKRHRESLLRMTNPNRRGG